MNAGLLEVLAIFREAIQESESDAGDVITPNAFASVMKDHGVMPGTKVPSANPKGNKSGGLKKMGRDAFKVDFALVRIVMYLGGELDEQKLIWLKMFSCLMVSSRNIQTDFANASFHSHRRLLLRLQRQVMMLMVSWTASSGWIFFRKWVFLMMMD